MGKYELALVDVDRVLKSYCKNHEALGQKAETLYDLGRYEMALVFFHRANKIKPESAKYQNGIEKSQDAINCEYKIGIRLTYADLVALDRPDLFKKSRKAHAKALNSPYFNGDRELLTRITKTETKSAVASKLAALSVQRMAERGLTYLKRREINL